MSKAKVDREAVVQQELEAFAMDRKTGINYAFSTRGSRGGLRVFRREHQPCFGELRKYAKTHKEQYTDPEPHDEYRPGDLHHPFPKTGAPDKLALRLNNPCPEYIYEYYSATKPKAPVDMDTIQASIDATRTIISFVLDPEVSPWRKALTGRVDLLTLESSPVMLVKSGRVDDIRQVTNVPKGIIFHSLDCDPTVLVNLLNHITHLYNNPSFGANYLKYVELVPDMTIMDYLAIRMCVNGLLDAPYGPARFSNYYSPYLLDYDRFVTGNTHDLTGGTLKDRYDYNRRRLHEIHSQYLSDQNGKWKETGEGIVSSKNKIDEEAKAVGLDLAKAWTDDPKTAIEFIRSCVQNLRVPEEHRTKIAA